MVEPDAAVVDTVEAQFFSAILDAHAAANAAVLSSNRDEKSVNSVPFASDEKLRKHRCQVAMAGGVSNVVLAG